MQDISREADVLVVGGGLAGLAAAGLAARAGLRVTLFEKSRELGGRAITKNDGGFQFNLGPHALYRQGPAESVLAELGVTYCAHRPPAAGLAIHRGSLHELPATPVSMMRSSLLGFGSKFEAARLLGRLRKADPSALRGMTVAEWLEREITDATVRQLLAAFLRVTSYANDPARQSAEASLRQFQAGLQGVSYLDGGWQVLVDGLRAAAEDAGARIITGVVVEEVVDGPGLRLEGGEHISAGSVVLAVPPKVAERLVPGRQWSSEAIAVQVACLELGLRRLPRPENRFALGIDGPFYFSVHSLTAKVAPEGGALIHVAKYGPGSRSELEDVTDLLQPGWREHVAVSYYLPEMVASNALVTASARPGPAIGGLDNVYLAGDWVGPEAMLCDAALASARSAVRMIADRARRKLVA